MIRSSWWPTGKCWRGFRHGAGRHEPSIDSSADPLDGRLPDSQREYTFNGPVIRDEFRVHSADIVSIGDLQPPIERRPLCNTSDDLRRCRRLLVLTLPICGAPKQQFRLLFLASDSFFF